MEKEVISSVGIWTKDVKVAGSYNYRFINGDPISKLGHDDHVIVHSGKFHADDVFATALMIHILEYTANTYRYNHPDGKYVGVPTMQFHRVNAKEVQPLIDQLDSTNESYIVADIGGGLFDHHQEGSPVREDGTPYAAFGRLWEKWGRCVIPDVDLCDEFDRTFVAPLDAHDSGLATNPLSVAISCMNPTWDSEENPFHCFEDAVEFAYRLLGKMFISYTSKLAAKAQVTEAPVDGNVLILDRYVPYKHWTRGNKEIDFAIYPSARDNGWCIGTTLSDEDSGEFANKYLLPEVWLGDAAPDGMTFCHKARFIASFKTKEQALHAAKLASILARESSLKFHEAVKKRSALLSSRNVVVPNIRPSGLNVDMLPRPTASHACEAMEALLKNPLP